MICRDVTEWRSMLMRVVTEWRYTIARDVTWQRYTIDTIGRCDGVKYYSLVTRPFLKHSFAYFLGQNINFFLFAFCLIMNLLFPFLQLIEKKQIEKRWKKQALRFNLLWDAGKEYYWLFPNFFLLKEKNIFSLKVHGLHRIKNILNIFKKKKKQIQPSTIQKFPFFYQFVEYSDYCLPIYYYI